MTLTSIVRAISPGSKNRHLAPVPPSQAVAEDSRRRHPAMSGLSVSSVHGQHCICERCDSEHGRLAG